MQGSAYVGDLKTLWARSRSDARTTNLLVSVWKSGRVEYVLVEDGYTAERSACPLFEIGLESRVQCLDERAHERYLERRPSNGPFAPDVHD